MPFPRPHQIVTSGSVNTLGVVIDVKSFKQQSGIHSIKSSSLTPESLPYDYGLLELDQ